MQVEAMYYYYYYYYDDDDTAHEYPQPIDRHGQKNGTKSLLLLRTEGDQRQFVKTKLSGLELSTCTVPCVHRRRRQHVMVVIVCVL
jgi:hypothetical protein